MTRKARSCSFPGTSPARVTSAGLVPLERFPLFSRLLTSSGHALTSGSGHKSCHSPLEVQLAADFANGLCYSARMMLAGAKNSGRVIALLILMLAALAGL